MMTHLSKLRELLLSALLLFAVLALLQSCASVDQHSQADTPSVQRPHDYFPVARNN